MKAIYYRQFNQKPELRELPDPAPMPDGVVIGVRATGLCRSDWHGWRGEDADIRLPHVPGHELAGVITAVGADVRRWQVGQRVTVPFVGGCGRCVQCLSGNQQVCDDQFQPGFTHWGAFAEYVSIERADINLVELPETMAFATAASLGCRFVTAFRAVVDQAQVQGGQWVAVHGCGGVGLSTVMIAHALGAQVVAVDINPETLDLALSIGATATINAAESESVSRAVRDATGGGAHVSVDALGHPDTARNSVLSLRKRGKHIQIGILGKEHAKPMIGSHGMQAHRYPELFGMITAGKLAPEQLIGRRISLAEVVNELPAMNTFKGTGITVVDRF
jgi:alcohol dehydrogenase